ncbi:MULTISPECIES: Lnb N-terminal periplasmic domain-containing protein [unclassified Leisingera]|uniref:Lnb N-terminal periplasmic domain-containing protein n=1 Tax=unclassified Leisingera TaxID=2614906 RepID=UPI0003122464|nr:MULTISPECIES: DUF4105 domain-containing protein [unclassified Leisingera]KIC16881.1 membrane protein [Leisingera sp. ANG-DT]KIC25797.1 membrane protein [Leisingera sp. ANG-S3]KIC54530.1 membrane protein [Leisingera sp. ANG-S]KID11161.1 membrane protein [Leisingera sp. ANG1]
MFRLIKGVFTGAAILAVALATVWAVMALWYRLPFEALGRGALAGGIALLGLAVIAGLFRRRALRALTTFVLALAAVILWWSTLTPPADRNWSPDVARQVTGTVEGDILTLSGVRNFTWDTPENFTEAWESRSYDLTKLQSTDLFMSYWAGPQMAHMIVSFGFEGGEHIAWSVEVRRQLGGGFSPIADLFKSNTLVLIAADERDLVGTRTNARGEDVQLFRIGVSPDTGRELLLKYVETANSLAAQPQWYNSLTTNCTTVVMTLIRSFAEDVPLDWRVLANGYLPEFAWEQGVLDQSRSVEDLRALGSITPIAQAHGVGPDYSAMIREGVPAPAQD